MVLIQENIGTFHVSMENIEVVETFQPFNYLNYDLPDVLFLHPMLGFVALTNSLEDISIISKFHDNAKLAVNQRFLLTTKYLMPHRKKLLCTMQHKCF